MIQFAPGLPKTRSGKIMRRILRKIAEGDTSSLGDISTLAVDLVLGCLHHDGAGGVVARPPGPPGHLVELPRLQVPHPGAVVLHQRGQQHQVRIGTLMPTPSVSVPAITVSRPAWASCSTSRRYFGSIPAWCTPTPCRTSRESVRTEAGREPELADPPRRSGPSARRLATLRLVIRLGQHQRTGLGEVHDVDRRLSRHRAGR